MKILFGKLFIFAFAFSGIFIFSGCSGQNGAVWNSPYSAEYKIATDGSNVFFETTVKGPAEKLAVILTSPDGKSDVRVIGKDQMMSNCQTVHVYMEKPQEGNWVLSVKTVEPEKIVWQTNISLSLEKLAITDMKLNMEMFDKRPEGCFFNGVDVTVVKDGNLPVVFSGAAVSIDGINGQASVGFGSAMTGQSQTVKIPASCRPTPAMEQRDRARGGLPYAGAFFMNGERHKVRVSLFYGQDKKSVDFEEELMAPQ